MLWGSFCLWISNTIPAGASIFFTEKRGRQDSMDMALYTLTPDRPPLAAAAAAAAVGAVALAAAVAVAVAVAAEAAASFSSHTGPV